MELLDNRRQSVADFVTARMASAEDLSVLTSSFSIYAFVQLLGRLSTLHSLKLLFAKKPHEVDLVNERDAEERALRNGLTQQSVAAACREWLAAHADIRAAKDAGLVRQNNVIASETAALHGSADLTAAGLGLIPSSRYAMSVGVDEQERIAELATWFASVWDDAENVSDVRAAVLERLARLAADKTPDFVYHEMLYHLFDAKHVGLEEDDIINTRTGIKDHRIWKRLYSFQRDCVVGAVDKLEKYNGCIIADSVGLGKTFEALAVIKYYELRNDRVLVLCPKKLRENWTVYLQNDRRNILCEDRFNYDVLCHSDLSRTGGMSGDVNLATINWGNYDLVVIDESHNFRNNPPSKKKGPSRYRRLMRDIIRSGVKTKVLMLSATPVNNRLADLKNQVFLISAGDDAAFAKSGIASVEKTLAVAQKDFNRWLKTPDHDTRSLMAAMHFGYFKLLDLLTIARSRKHVEKYYRSRDVGKFPERLKPINVKSDIDRDGAFPALQDVNRDIQRLHLAAYSPLKYVLPEKLDAYARKYDVEMDGGSVFKQIDREESLIRLMRSNVFKRMESSIHSFARTSRKLLEAVKSLQSRLERFGADAETGGEPLDINDVEIDAPEFEDLLVGAKVKVLIRDCDVKRWRQELADDREQLEKLVSSAEAVGAPRDLKLAALREMVAEKVQNPINADNRKIIVFTAFADTAAYLYEEIAEWAHSKFGIHSALVTGTGTNRTTLAGIRTDIHSILTNFSPRSKERNAAAGEPVGDVDLLFATDCISEGQNLQDCDWLVNYDIHWNPVRIIQRFGRIDRIGSVNEKIQLVNFWPNMELDAYIDLESRVRGRMVLVDVTAAGEENVIEYTPEMNDLEYRRRQLRELQNAVLDLEDIPGGVSITDLTLNDFRMDLVAFLKENAKTVDGTPFGARAVINTEAQRNREVSGAAGVRVLPAVGSARRADRPGAVFCLRDMSGKAPADSAYALAPHYLVYVADDGEIVYGHNQARETLDFLRLACAGASTVQSEALAAFNRKTKKGSDMAHYQELLGKAVASVVGREQAEGVKSLFERGGIRLAGTTDRTVNDFEVVAFVVVM